MATQSGKQVQKKPMEKYRKQSEPIWATLDVHVNSYELLAN